MKKMMEALVAILMIGLLGGFMIQNHRTTTTSADSSLEQGRQNIQQNQYNLAVVNFKQALDAQPNNQAAVRSLQQVQLMQSADQFYQMQHFVTAIQEYQKVIDLGQVSELVQRAHSQLNSAQGLLTGAINFTNTYNRALRLNHATKYKQSTQVLQATLRDGNFSNPYFKLITDRIKTLQKANAVKRLDNSTVTNRLAIRPQSVNESANHHQVHLD